MLQKRIVTKYINPPEAGPIAEEYRKAAREVRAIASRVRNTGKKLDVGWKGKSRNKFFSKFDSTPSELERYASTLEQLANDIKRIQVLIEVEEWYEVSGPGT